MLPRHCICNSGGTHYYPLNERERYGAVALVSGHGQQCFQTWEHWVGWGVGAMCYLGNHVENFMTCGIILGQ